MLDADVELAFGAFLEVVDAAAGEQLAGAQDHDVVADELDVGQEVAGEEQAHAFLVGEAAGHGEQFVAALGVHAVGRLVEDEEPGVVDDGGGELQALLHAGGIGFGLAVAGLAEADVVEHFVGALHGVAGAHAAQLAGVGDEVDAGEAGEEAFVLGDEADGLADVEAVLEDVEAEDAALAAVDGDKAEQGADHGGLARAVGTEQADGPFGHGDGEVAESGDLAVGLGDGVQLEQHAPASISFVVVIVRAGEEGGWLGSRFGGVTRIFGAGGENQARGGPMAAAACLTRT